MQRNKANKKTKQHEIKYNKAQQQQNSMKQNKKWNKKNYTINKKTNKQLRQFFSTSCFVFHRRKNVM